MAVWEVESVSEEVVKRISDEFGISRVLSEVLVSRGIDTSEKAKKFLFPNIYHLYPPFLFKDMVKAVDRIIEALKKGETVFIFGDRDVDGVTSTALLYRALRKAGFKKGKLAWKVPSGDDPYGMTKDAVDFAYAINAKLIITVDNGIVAVEEVEYANSLGIDVIITDHHEAGEVLPPAYAIINPKVPGETYPFSGLSGCSVAMKLSMALLESLFLPYYNRELVVFDLETTGLNPVKDEIIEIGAVKIKNGIIIDKFNALIKPKKKIPPEITEITGITNEMLENQKTIEEVLPQFIEFIGNSVLVGHNVEFDVSFLKEKARRILKVWIGNEQLDTLELSRKILKHLSHHKLHDVVSELKIDEKKFHRADSDSEMTAEVLRRLLFLKNEKIKSFFFGEALPLAAISTVADVMPLIEENRVIVSEGLKVLMDTNITGLQRFLLRLNLPSPLKAKDIAWKISPVLNSPGRLGQADKAVALLITHDTYEMEGLIEEILSADVERKEIGTVGLDAVMKQVEESGDSHSSIVIASEDVEQGTTGLIATRIAHIFNKPSVIISLSGSGEEVTGSARAIGRYSIIDAVRDSGDLLLQFGGHQSAAGFTLLRENVDEFIEKIRNFIDSTITTEDLTPVYKIDAEVKPEEMTEKVVKELELLEPTGHGNPAPVFISKDLVIRDVYRFGKENQHLKIKIDTPSGPIYAIWWNGYEKGIAILGEKYPYPHIDMVHQMEINEYRDLTEVRLIVKDIRKS